LLNKEISIMGKFLFYLLVSLFITLAFVGCDERDEMAPQPRQNSDIQSNKDAFPDFLVGVWEIKEGEYKDKWGFKFEPDGSISKLIHLVAGEVRMEEGGSQLEGREEGSYAVFVMGPYSVDYTASSRELDVRVTLEHFRMEMPIGVLEGSTDDYFRGTVSEDGKTWKVNWISYGYLEGADDPDPNVVEANPVPLVFTKSDIK
jgi:hypothetical protein